MVMQDVAEDRWLIYPDKKKLMGGMLGTLGVVAASVFMLRSPLLFGPPILSYIVAISGMLFFGLGFLIILYRLIKPTPQLILDRNGLTSGDGQNGSGVTWNEILSTQISSYQGQRYLLILLKDPEEFLARQPKGRRKMVQYGVDKLGTPIAIPANLLPISLENLQERIEMRLSRNPW